MGRSNSRSSAVYQSTPLFIVERYFLHSFVSSHIHTHSNQSILSECPKLNRNQEISFTGQFFACYALVELHQREKNGCYILSWKISSHKKCSFCIEGGGLGGCIWLLLIYEGKKKRILKYWGKIMVLSRSLCLYFFI